jgi:UDP-N-acetylmuramate: L-alanyl-gamma-D-glutamyl-meso-diaminopimelate ligase
MKNIHFIGICGAGMAGIAVMLRKAGYVVSGSDEGFYDPIASYLKKNGFDLVPGYRPENIPDETDTVIIGKHAKLVPESNAEVAHAYQLRADQRLRILSFPELLQEITADRTRIVICGSYGKSTATALIAWCLTEAKKDPGYFIGGQVYGLTDSCVLGTGPFIFEGDEYPSANWDNRSKFEFYAPHHLLLTSGEHDHVNVFKTHASFLERFEILIKALPDTGICVGCIENDSVDRLLGSAAHAITYGVEQGFWHAKNLAWGDTTSFDLYKGDDFITTLTTTLLGKHNVQNIIGAAALMIETGLLTAQECAEGITTFKGVQRRLDRIDTGGRVPIYEGFGSAYAKARSAIEAIRLHYPDKKIYCVFEPHTFSWRDPGTSFWYKDVFDDVENIVIVTPPVEHGKDVAGQLTPSEMIALIESDVVSKEVSSTPHEAFAMIKNTLAGKEEDYCVLILTSGEALGLGPLLVGWSQSL